MRVFQFFDHGSNGARGWIFERRLAVQSRLKGRWRYLKPRSNIVFICSSRMGVFEVVHEHGILITTSQVFAGSKIILRMHSFVAIVLDVEYIIDRFWNSESEDHCDDRRYGAKACN